MLSRAGEVREGGRELVLGRLRPPVYKGVIAI